MVDLEALAVAVDDAEDASAGTQGAHEYRFPPAASDGLMEERVVAAASELRADRKACQRDASCAAVACSEGRGAAATASGDDRWGRCSGADAVASAASAAAVAAAVQGDSPLQRKSVAGRSERRKCAISVWPASFRAHVALSQGRRPKLVVGSL